MDNPTAEDAILRMQARAFDHLDDLLHPQRRKAHCLVRDMPESKPTAVSVIALQRWDDGDWAAAFQRNTSVEWVADAWQLRQSQVLADMSHLTTSDRTCFLPLKFAYTLPTSTLGPDEVTVVASLSHFDGTVAYFDLEIGAIT